MPDPVARRGLLPSGTVTFAFTDIEGSTLRWERDSAAMENAVRRHDVLVRAAIEEHGGHVFKTVGDAFCAAFSRPQDAIAAVLAAQRAVAAENFSAVDGLRVRAAIHTGTAEERCGDYFGPAVNRAARLLAIAHGGQVLVSGTTTHLVQDELPAQATLRDLGEHVLKDLARPEQVYQLLAPDLAHDFAPLRSLGSLPNNLPRMLTSFVGREQEFVDITALLERHQLVTLVGSGGIGKTRTSLQVAANLLDGSGDGVWFVELAPLTSGDYIPSTVAQVFGITLPSDGEPIENLVRALKTKHALLLFDNCEHLIEPAARVIAAILRSCPQVKVLASSRQGLGIAGEEKYRLPTLAVPKENDATSLTASEVIQCAAVALFAERAHTVDKRFALSDENAPIVADICRRLDGIPLAIELAAARVNILSPRQLRERLDERFRVLTGGSRDVLPRQQTLRALIDWSHDLLDERKRTLFRRLGIFVNGFTLEGAAAVGNGEDLDELDIFDMLSSLVDKSLVLAEPAGDDLRYRLLESTRVYAAEKLADAGEREVCASRHLRYLRNRFAEARRQWEITARRAEMDAALATELEDVRAVLDRSAVRGSDVSLGGELLAEIGSAWDCLGLVNEGLWRIEAFLALIEDEPRLIARLWIAVAFLAANSGRKTRELEAAKQAVAQARLCGDQPTLAEALQAYSESVARLGRFDDAQEALQEAEVIPGVSAALHLRVLQARAIVSSQRRDLAMAARAFEQLRDKHRSLGNDVAERTITLSVAEVEHARGQTQRAVALVREVMPAVRTQNDPQRLVGALANLAGYLAALDDFSGARETASEAIRELAGREPEAAFVAIAIEHLALALALSGDLLRAVSLAGYADAALQRHGYEREFTEATSHDRLSALLREHFSPDDLSARLAQGAALSPQDAVALALEERVALQRSMPS
ncbi:MAG: adenylate/guanylate cyclase domain-containing protein [Candidatus Eremiobacteraeota bacterium]|nr:adenylate/guanylate cyclase domain-containing protein [Candidatus Eremiobacteraeota bacterium]